MSSGEPACQPPAIVLGGVGAALSITRSLGRAGIPVFVLGDAGNSLAGASRYCTEFVDTGADGDAVASWMQWLRGAPRGAVVLPCGDDGLDLVATHGEELREWGLRPLSTAGEASRAMLDKERTYEIAAECGVPAPAIWHVSGSEELDAVRGELRYPCALKPLHSHRFSKHFDFKVFVAENREQLREALALAQEHELEMLVTEIVPGPDDSVWSLSTFIGEAGEPLFEFTERKLRSYPVHFGIGTYHETRWEPEVAEVGMRFLRCAGLRGMLNVELKRDASDGSLKLIECNHRFEASNETLRRAGIDASLIAYRQTLGEPVEVGPWRQGLRLWMPALDIRSAAEMRAEGDLTWPRWLASLVHFPLYLHVLSPGDPKPSAVNVGRRVRNRIGRVLGGGG